MQSYINNELLKFQNDKMIFEKENVDNVHFNLIMDTNGEKIQQKDSTISKEILDYAKKAYTVLDCKGLSRVDFFINRDDGSIYLNEINTIPGSLSFYLWAPLGVKYSVVLDAMIKLALRRSREEEAIEFSFESDILRNFAAKGAKGSKGTKGAKGSKL